MPEAQYQGYDTLHREHLGLRANQWWQTDPRSLLFSMARYHFVAKMLSGFDSILEVGCGDAFCTRLVRQEVQHITAIDFDPMFINDAVQRTKFTVGWGIDLVVHDILKGPVTNYKGEKFCGAYALELYRD